MFARLAADRVPERLELTGNRQGAPGLVAIPVAGFMKETAMVLRNKKQKDASKAKSPSVSYASGRVKASRSPLI